MSNILETFILFIINPIISIDMSINTSTTDVNLANLKYLYIIVGATIIKMMQLASFFISLRQGFPLSSPTPGLK